MQIYLVSKSKRRIKILKTLLKKFKIINSNIPEDNIKIKKPSFLVKKLAKEKVTAISGKFKEGIFLGFDTIVYFNSEIIGKPKNKQGAVKILEKLSGKWHKVYTGIYILNKYNKKNVSDYEISFVKFKKLSGEFIEKYSIKHFDKAGSYAVQEKEDSPVEKIIGDYYNVVGFPVEIFKKQMEKICYGIIK